MIAYSKLVKIFFYALLFFFLILTKSFFDWEKNLTNKLYPNVYIDNVNFGKKGKDDII